MKRLYDRNRTAERRARLAVERKLLFAEYPGLQATPGDIQWQSEAWVKMWVDMSYCVFSEDGAMYARRGITDDGQMIWQIRHLQRPLAFHALGHDPEQAFTRASTAWARCDALAERRGEIKALCRDLLLGRERFEVTVEDAAASPLSSVEVRFFMRRMGLSRRRRVSGRLAALMALVEPQVGIVILTAHRRQARRTAGLGKAALA
ncbi:hypothetical protein [Marinovum sp.]|uniref:hypothetical protein n=1 Tax=Marinovum sp. TaxID=2024839 RepID=UPI003A90AEC0